MKPTPPPVSMSAEEYSRFQAQQAAEQQQQRAADAAADKRAERRLEERQWRDEVRRQLATLEQDIARLARMVKAVGQAVKRIESRSAEAHVHVHGAVTVGTEPTAGKGK